MNTALSDLLSLQIANVDKLFVLLESETESLQKRNVPSLEKISLDKQTLVTTISELDSKINQHTDFELLSSDFAEQKTYIESRLTQCQEINDINGKIIELNLRNSKRLEDKIVRSRSKNNITYDRLGRTKGSISSLGMKFRS